ncbi:hypothetical protein CRG98_035563, partial [Punica granatum]
LSQTPRGFWFSLRISSGKLSSGASRVACADELSWSKALAILDFSEGNGGYGGARRLQRGTLRMNYPGPPGV